EGKLLRVFPTDADVPKDAINAKVDETFVPRAKVELPEKGGFGAWRSGIIGELGRRCLRDLSRPIPEAVPIPTRDGMTTLRTEPGIKLEYNFALRILKAKALTGSLVVLNPTPSEVDTKLFDYLKRSPEEFVGEMRKLWSVDWLNPYLED